MLGKLHISSPCHTHKKRQQSQRIVWSLIISYRTGAIKIAAASITVSSASGHDIWLSCGLLLLSRGLRVRIPRGHFSVGLHLAAQRWVGTISTSAAQSCSRGGSPQREWRKEMLRFYYWRQSCCGSICQYRQYKRWFLMKEVSRWQLEKIRFLAQSLRW